MWLSPPSIARGSWRMIDGRQLTNRTITVAQTVCQEGHPCSVDCLWISSRSTTVLGGAGCPVEARRRTRAGSAVPRRGSGSGRGAPAGFRPHRTTAARRGRCGRRRAGSQATLARCTRSQFQGQKDRADDSVLLKPLLVALDPRGASCLFLAIRMAPSPCRNRRSPWSRRSR